MEIRLLLLLCFLITACNQNAVEQEQIIDEKPAAAIDDPATEVSSDSLTIRIKMSPGSSLVFNMNDELNSHYGLDFENKSDVDSTISKTILNKNKQQLISRGNLVRNDDGEFIKYRSHIIITDTTRYLDLDLKDYELSIVGNRTDPEIDVSDMMAAYDDLRARVFKEEGTDLANLDELDALRRKYSLQYSSSTYRDASATQTDLKLQKQLNQHYYYEILYDISPEHPDLDSIFYELNLDLEFPPGNGIKYDFIKNNIDSIDYGNLDQDPYTDIYRHNLTMGLLHYLGFEKDKKAGKHIEAREWLKSTDFYKNNRQNIELRITPLDKREFVKLLTDLAIVDRDADTLTFRQMMRKHPSKYYMLDLWATWCEPCLSNMKLLDEKQLPKKLSIVNLSVDFEKDIADWETFQDSAMTDKISYRLVPESDNYQAFSKLLKIEQIPRYIMITKDLQLMHAKFYAPYEPQFDGAIESLDRWRYW